MATVPGAPTNVIAVGGTAQAIVSWTAPASNGGASITSYTVTANPGGATATTADGNTLNATVTGLFQNGTSYTFTVIATNSVGNSAASTASNQITLNAVIPGNGTMTAAKAAALVPKIVS